MSEERTILAPPSCWSSSCGRVTLYLGDSLDTAPLLVGVDAIISDPPYGISYYHSGGCSGKTSTLYNVASAKAKSFAGKSPFIFGDDKPFDPSTWLIYPTVALCGANYFSSRLPEGGRWMVWDKKENPENYGKLSFADCEIIWCNQPGVARIYHHLWQGCRRRGESNRDGKLHPNQKPISLMAWVMEQAKVPAGATVLDPYMGSGTTGIACIRTGRKFIGIEIDARYFEIARARLENELRQGLLPLTPSNPREIKESEG